MLRTVLLSSFLQILLRKIELTLELKRIALRAHQEARQSLDLRKDLARRVMPSDGPYSKGDRVFVWMKDESKKKTEGIWVRGKLCHKKVPCSC